MVLAAIQKMKFRGVIVAMGNLRQRWEIMKHKHRQSGDFYTLRRALTDLPVRLITVAVLGMSITMNAMAMQPVSSDVAAKRKVILGWLQSVRLLPSEDRMTAKLDSGAKSSALHAVDIKLFSKDGEDYVSFVVPVEDEDGEKLLHYERPLVKESKVKRHGFEELDVRPVVSLDFCIDGQIYQAQFSLDDREKFNYPMLLGRRFLEQHFLIDPSQTFLKKYQCP